VLLDAIEERIGPATERPNGWSSISSTPRSRVLAPSQEG
jgi:hypothetical protein